MIRRFELHRHADRQAYALAHPLDTAGADLDVRLDHLAALKADDPLPGGNWLRSILAVDRGCLHLNDGAPVWHASISIWTPDLRPVRAPGVAERAGIRLLAGVGNHREWWYWNPAAMVGHLRVGLTPAEIATLTCVPAEDDAGEAGPAGPERRRRAP